MDFKKLGGMMGGAIDPMTLQSLKRLVDQRAMEGQDRMVDSDTERRAMEMGLGQDRAIDSDADRKAFDNSGPFQSLAGIDKLTRGIDSDEERRLMKMRGLQGR